MFACRLLATTLLRRCYHKPIHLAVCEQSKAPFALQHQTKPLQQCIHCWLATCPLQHNTYDSCRPLMRPERRAQINGEIARLKRRAAFKLKQRPETFQLPSSWCFGLVVCWLRRGFPCTLYKTRGSHQQPPTRTTN